MRSRPSGCGRSGGKGPFEKSGDAGLCTRSTAASGAGELCTASSWSTSIGNASVYSAVPPSGSSAASSSTSSGSSGPAPWSSPASTESTPGASAAPVSMSSGAASATLSTTGASAAPCVDIVVGRFLLHHLFCFRLLARLLLNFSQLGFFFWQNLCSCERSRFVSSGLRRFLLRRSRCRFRCGAFRLCRWRRGAATGRPPAEEAPDPDPPPPSGVAFATAGVPGVSRAFGCGALDGVGCSALGVAWGLALGFATPGTPCCPCPCHLAWPRRAVAFLCPCLGLCCLPWPRGRRSPDQVAPRTKGSNWLRTCRTPEPPRQCSAGCLRCLGV